MLPIMFEPLKEMREMERRVLSAFDRYPAVRSGDFAPSVNVREGEYAYHIEADLPGVPKEQIKVDVEGNRLTISGERTTREEVKEEEYYRMESSFGSFTRSFAIPEDADVENIHANNRDGVLEVVIPKKSESKEEPRSIPVK